MSLADALETTRLYRVAYLIGSCTVLTVVTLGRVPPMTSSPLPGTSAAVL